MPRFYNEIIIPKKKNTSHRLAGAADLLFFQVPEGGGIFKLEIPINSLKEICQTQKCMFLFFLNFNYF